MSRNNRRVLIVDDSGTIRAMIDQLLAGNSGMSVVGVVSSAEEALEAIDGLRPDVMTLDIVMPGIDGLTLLSRIMREHRLPIVIVSSSTQRKSATVEKAMKLGAAACFDKARLLSHSAEFVTVVSTAEAGVVEPESETDVAKPANRTAIAGGRAAVSGDDLGGALVPGQWGDAGFLWHRSC